MMFDCLLLSYSCKRMTCNVGTLDFHVDKIERCCRTCAKFINKDRVTYLCNEKRIEDKLRDVWNVRPAENDTAWCPKKMCNNCWIKLNKFEKQNNTCIETPTKSFRIYSWLPHEEQNGEQGGCTVCEDFKERIKGNRKKGPRKLHFGRGRPKMTSPCSSQSVLSAACEIAQDVFVATLPTPNPPFERFVEPSRDIVCPVCLDILSSPVQGPCEHAYCANCVTRHLREKPATLQSKCPVCNQAINFSTLQKIPRILQNLIREAKVKCRTCGTAVEFDGLKSHESLCKGKENEPLDRNEDGTERILATPATQPLSVIEEKVVTHLMKRKLADTSIQTSKHRLLHLKTGGTVSHFYSLFYST